MTIVSVILALLVLILIAILVVVCVVKRKMSAVYQLLRKMHDVMRKRNFRMCEPAISTTAMVIV